MKLRKTILCAAVSAVYSASAMSYNLSVNDFERPSRSVEEAIKIVVDHERKCSRSNCVSSALSHISGTNQWWLVICRGVSEVDGYRTSISYFVNPQGLQEDVYTVPDCEIPDVEWPVVLSAVKASGLPCENIVSMGWVLGGGCWSVQFMTGEHYDLDKRRCRLVKSKGTIVSRPVRHSARAISHESSSTNCFPNGKWKDSSAPMPQKRKTDCSMPEIEVDI